MMIMRPTGADLVLHSPERALPGATAVTWHGYANCYRVPVQLPRGWPRMRACSSISSTASRGAASRPTAGRSSCTCTRFSSRAMRRRGAAEPRNSRPPLRPGTGSSPRFTRRGRASSENGPRCRHAHCFAVEAMTRAAGRTNRRFHAYFGETPKYARFRTQGV